LYRDLAAAKLVAQTAELITNGTGGERAKSKRATISPAATTDPLIFSDPYKTNTGGGSSPVYDTGGEPQTAASRQLDSLLTSMRDRRATRAAATASRHATLCIYMYI